MKLAIIITTRSYQKKLKKSLIENRFGLTQFDSIGGFLNKKNTTFLVAIEDNKIEKLTKTITSCCKLKEEIITSPPPISSEAEELLTTTNTSKITAGGATVFILPLEKIIKI